MKLVILNASIADDGGETIEVGEFDIPPERSCVVDFIDPDQLHDDARLVLTGTRDDAVESGLIE